MDIISKIQNITFVANYCMWAYSFYKTVICNETATPKTWILNFHTLSIFPALEIKKLALVGKLLWRFWHNFAQVVDSFVFLLDITVMINILQEIIKTLHKKMLKAINFYRFHNDAWEKKFTRWSFQRSLNKWIEVRHISCLKIFLDIYQVQSSHLWCLSNFHHSFLYCNSQPWCFSYNFHRWGNKALRMYCHFQRHI